MRSNHSDRETLREIAMLFVMPLSVVANSLYIKRDLHSVADDNASSIESRIPIHAKIVPVNDGVGHKTGAGFWTLVDAVFPPWCWPLAQVVDI